MSDLFISCNNCMALNDSESVKCHNCFTNFYYKGFFRFLHKHNTTNCLVCSSCSFIEFNVTISFCTQCGYEFKNQYIIPFFL